MRLKKEFGYLSILLIAVLILSACAPGAEEEVPAFPEVETPAPGETEVLPETGPLESTPRVPTDPLEFTPPATVEPTAGTPAVIEEGEVTGTPSTGGPPTSSGAIIEPESGRAVLTRLSTLMGFQVSDREGQTLGTANDFILNMCEAHVLYIVLDADPALGLQAGEQALIPYEIVSLHSGVLNSEERTVQLDVAISDVQNMPPMNRDTFDVTTDEWEAKVQEYWTTHGNLSLTTECRVPATGQVETGATPTGEASGVDRVTLHKNAFASDVLEATVVDGNGQPLGTVEEVLLVPESGRLTFAAVRLNADLQADQNLALVPLGALNLQDETATEAVTLVLLVETSVLAGAPQEGSLPDPADTGWESQSLDYWGQFVPLTREELP